MKHTPITKLLGILGLHKAKPAPEIPHPCTPVEIMTAMAKLEAKRKQLPNSFTQRVLSLLDSDTGLETLLVAAGEALKENPDSPLLLYLQSMAMAKLGNPQEAQQNITAAILRYVKTQNNGASKAHFERLNRIWRILDTILRDQMQWSDSSPAMEDQTDAPPPEEDSDAESLFFAEPLLQNRQKEKYLLACRRNFTMSQEPRVKLLAIQEMVRVGLRRMPDYHDAYSAARECYQILRPELMETLREERFLEDPDQALGLASAALRTLRKLSLPDDVALLEQRLLWFIQQTACDRKIWRVARLLVERVDPGLAREVREHLTASPLKPSKPGEINDFFAWAYRVGENDLAHELYATLPSGIRKAAVMRYYSEILQSEGKFYAALTLAKTIHARLITLAYSMNPLEIWKVWRRIGELTFASDTAAIYSSVPQPVDPKGVLFLSPHNFDILRRLPLVVLMELKRRGWAVVPLVRGLLPLEPTGRPEIDQFLGCLRMPTHQFTAEAAATFTKPQGFHVDVGKGELRWNDIDLSHALWEDAAINRRRYNIDYSCPDLQVRMSKLADRTYQIATVLENAHREIAALGLPCAYMVVLPARLPDAVVRLYCARHGDPNTFFCVHAANGYQNYFTNLTHPYSTKMSLRNLTTPANVRTAIFPEPAEFEMFYRNNAKQADTMLAMVSDITKLRRAAYATESPREAALCRERIRCWREKGGKVACAFGKIVCDSAVPHDGGPAHRNLKDWINHTVASVAGSKTLLLIKPHPHELRNEIGAFLTEFFQNLIEVPLSDNVVMLGHDWFIMDDMKEMIDVGLLYNSTTSIELGLLGIPSVLCSDFGPIDYPIGHTVPRDRKHYEQLVRFEAPLDPPPDLQKRAAAWIYYMSGDNVALNYRFHARPATNRVIYPPWWFDEIGRYLVEGNRDVDRLADRITGSSEPAGMASIPAVQPPHLEAPRDMAAHSQIQEPNLNPEPEPSTNP